MWTILNIRLFVWIAGNRVVNSVASTSPLSQSRCVNHARSLVWPSQGFRSAVAPTRKAEKRKLKEAQHEESICSCTHGAEQLHYVLPKPHTGPVLFEKG